MASIGAMSAVAVRHERRKKKDNEKKHMEKLGRPSRLLLNPAGGGAEQHLSPAASRAPSRTPSRTGSIANATTRWKQKHQSMRYGDECWGDRVSLLHFIVVFFLAGVTLLIVGAVQYKKEAGLHEHRKLIVALGCGVIVLGCLLFIMKCACFCRPRSISSPCSDSEHAKFPGSHRGSKEGRANGMPVLITTDESGHRQNAAQQMETFDSTQIFVNTEDGLQHPNGETDMHHADNIISADIEICHTNTDIV